MTRTQFIIGKYIYYDTGGGDSSSQSSSLEFGNPIGTIISFMGNTPPAGYLTCDGTVYNIEDYQELANFIKNQFGSYNNFGGNGETTFAVPDLRGEFLRGSGTATRDTGSGDNVGVHQNPTEHIVYACGTANTSIEGRLFLFGNTNYTGSSPAYNDKVTLGTNRIGYRSTSREVENISGPTKYTSRPTNTSVMYCIKYTEVKRISKDNASIDLNEIGHITWEMYLKKGYLKLDGSSLQNASTAYSELLEFAQEYELITSDSTDDSKFKYDDSTDKLTLPNFIDKTLWGGGDSGKEAWITEYNWCCK